MKLYNANNLNNVIFHKDIYINYIKSLKNKYIKDDKPDLNDYELSNIDYDKKEIHTINWYVDMQNIIVYGNNWIGKSTFVDHLIKDIYQLNNLNAEISTFTINNYSNHCKEIIIKKSDYHIVINPENWGVDKYTIYETIETFNASINLKNNSNNKFNIIVVDNSHNLSYYAQSSLRCIIESNVNNCKFIFICNDIDKMIEAIISRCILINFKNPKKDNIWQFIYKIIDVNKFNIDEHNIKLLINNNVSLNIIKLYWDILSCHSDKKLIINKLHSFINYFIKDILYHVVDLKQLNINNLYN